MKTNVLSILLITTIITFSCNVNKTVISPNLKTNIPFKILSTNYKSWVDEQADVHGVKVSIEIDTKKVLLDSIYFKNFSQKFAKDLTARNNLFVASFTLPKTKKDYNLNSDSKKEYGNTPPSSYNNSTFQLLDNQAVISYIYKRKTYYFKLENLIKN